MTSGATLNTERNQVLERNDFQRNTCLSVVVAIGALTLVGAVFLILAAHQVLPHGSNLVSALGWWKWPLSFGSLACSLSIIFVGGCKLYQRLKSNELNESGKADTEVVSKEDQLLESDLLFASVKTQFFPPSNSFENYGKRYTDCTKFDYVLYGKGDVIAKGNALEIYTMEGKNRDEARFIRFKGFSEHETLTNFGSSRLHAILISSDEKSASYFITEEGHENISILTNYLKNPDHKAKIKEPAILVRLFKKA